MSETTQKTEQQLKAEARNAAQNVLNENHRDELRDLTKAEFEKRGLTYAPRKTDEEKAKEQLDKLLAQYPNLVQTVEAQPEQVTPSAQFTSGAPA